MSEETNRMPTEIDLHSTTDAKVWADEFIRITSEKPEIATDHGTMLGWFANAIMAGYDEARRRYEKVDGQDAD